MFNSGATVLSFVNLTLSGFFFALYAIIAGNIWGVCGLHFGWNYALSGIFGLNVSGEQSTDCSLFLSHNIGMDFFTGGDFGTEGGFITTMFLICVILIVSIIYIKKHKAPFSNKV